MPWVQYDDSGAICGVCANQQNSIYSENFLPDDDPSVAAYLKPAPAAGVSVTPRQARLALLAAGLLPAVENAVKTAGGATQITWEYATEIDRTSDLIATLGSSLGLTDAAIDLLFKQAAAIK